MSLRQEEGVSGDRSGECRTGGGALDPVLRRSAGARNMLGRSWKPVSPDDGGHASEIPQANDAIVAALCFISAFVFSTRSCSKD